MKLINLNIKIGKTLTISMLLATLFISACGEIKEEKTSTNIESQLLQAQAYLDRSQFKPAYEAANNVIQTEPTNLDAYLILVKINQKTGQLVQNISLLESFEGNKTADYYFALVDTFQKSGKFISSQNIIEQNELKLRSQPERLEFYKAQQLFYSKQFQQAKTSFASLKESIDYKVESLIVLAKISAIENHFEEAHSILNEVNTIDPKNVESLFIQSKIYIQQGNMENAEKSLSEALSQLPTADIFTTQRIQVTQSLADVLMQQGRGAESMIYSQILSDEFPAAQAIKIQYDRALQLFKDQQFVASKELLLEILENNPRHKKSATLLGLIFYNEGDPQNAEKYLENIVDPEISPTKLTELYIATQLQQNKSEEVLNLLELIPEENRSNDTWILYAKAALQHNEFTKARLALDKAKELSPQSIQLALTESYYYNNLPEAQPEKALDVVSVILATYPLDQKLQVLYIRQLITLKKFTEADAYVINLKDNFSDNIDSQLIAANYYIYQSNITESKNLIKNALKLDNKNLQALYSLAKINLIEKNWQELLETYSQIIKLYPTELMAYRGVIASLIQQNKDPLTTSTSDYLPTNYVPSILALTLTDLTLQQGKLDLASTYADEAKNELPSKYQANLDRLKLQLAFAKTSTAFENKDYTKAQEILLDALEESPDNINLLSLLTRIKIRLTAYVEAKEVTEKIASLLPNNSLSTILESEIFIAQKQTEEAMNLLTSYWYNVKDENVAQVLYPLLKNSSADKALSFLDDWLNELPESLVAIRYQALHFQNTGNKDKALEIYNNLLEKDPNNIIALNNAAWLYFEQDNPIAITLAEKAYNLLPDNAAIVDTYGWILYKNGKLKESKELLEKAVLLAPNDKEIEDHLNQINTK